MAFTDGIALTGRTALVTGAASGIGRAMSLALLDAGARIAAVDIDAAGLSAFAASRAGVSTTVADVSRRADCERAVADVIAAGGFQILINCAGVSMNPATPPGLKRLPNFWELEPEGAERILAINAVGPLLLTRYAMPHLIAQGWGRIVNITTSFSTMLGAGFSVYGASKAALEASAFIWAKELEGTGITVNVLIPGGQTNTPFLPEHARAGALSPDLMQAPIRWLASTRSDGVTGCRFIARTWDTALDPDEAAKRTMAPAAWPGTLA